MSFEVLMMLRHNAVYRLLAYISKNSLSFETHYTKTITNTVIFTNISFWKPLPLAIFKIAYIIQVNMAAHA